MTQQTGEQTPRHVSVLLKECIENGAEEIDVALNMLAIKSGKLMQAQRESAERGEEVDVREIAARCGLCY